MKSIDFMDDLLRRNPLHYSRLFKQMTWLENATLEERKGWTYERLNDLCARAADTKYGVRVGGTRDIGSWPLLSNKELREDVALFVASRSLFAVPASTSGTSGVPLKLIRTPQSIAMEQLCIDRFAERAGCDLRQARTASLKGDNIKPPSDLTPPFWKFTSGGRRLLLSSNHLNRDTVLSYYDIVQQFRPDVMFVYPTSVEVLSDYLLQSGKRLHVPFVIASSEVLTSRARRVTEQALGCRLIEYYGQSERVAFAVSESKNEFSFVPGYAFIELEFTASEGDSDLYEIVGTPLWNTAMPLIRYRTGDLIRVPTGTTVCELEQIRYGLRTFPEIVGRSDDWYLDSPEGVRLMGLPHIARDTENVQQLQIVQESPSFVRFLIIPTEQFGEQDVAQIRHNASLKLPESVHISIEIVERPIRTLQGKAPYVIRNIDQKKQMYV